MVQVHNGRTETGNTALLVVAVSCMALLAAACGGSASSLKAGRHSTVRSPQGSSGYIATSSGRNSSRRSSRPRAVSSGSTSVPIKTSSSCTSRELTASASQGSGAGGQEGIVVVLKNTSTESCTLEGYPAAHFLGIDGDQVGPASIHESAPAPTPIVLAPGAEASTTLWFTSPAGVSAASCHPTAAAGVSVTPPSSVVSLTATIDITVCAVNSVLGTTPIVSGTAQSGL